MGVGVPGGLRGPGGSFGWATAHGESNSSFVTGSTPSGHHRRAGHPTWRSRVSNDHRNDEIPAPTPARTSRSVPVVSAGRRSRPDAAVRWGLGGRALGLVRRTGRRRDRRLRSRCRSGAGRAGSTPTASTSRSRCSPRTGRSSSRSGLVSRVKGLGTLRRDFGLARARPRLAVAGRGRAPPGRLDRARPAARARSAAGSTTQQAVGHGEARPGARAGPRRPRRGPVRARSSRSCCSGACCCGRCCAAPRRFWPW